MTVSEARAYAAEGHSAAGSMGPKIEAAVDFLAAGGGQAVITDPLHRSRIGMARKARKMTGRLKRRHSK